MFFIILICNLNDNHCGNFWMADFEKRPKLKPNIYNLFRTASDIYCLPYFSPNNIMLISSPFLSVRIPLKFSSLQLFYSYV